MTLALASFILSSLSFLFMCDIVELSREKSPSLLASVYTVDLPVTRTLCTGGGNRDNLCPSMDNLNGQITYMFKSTMNGQLVA